MSNTVADERAENPREDRETAECPVCNGTVREPRSGERWICEQCARYWEESEL